MTHIKTNLCVGGPKDGMLMNAGDRTFFRAPVLAAISETMPPFSPAVGYRYVTYVPMDIRSDDGLVSFWVPEGSTVEDLMTRLAAGYRSEERS